MPENVSLARKRGLFISLLRDTVAFPHHDVVHINYASVGLPSLISKALETPYVFTMHSVGSTWRRLNGTRKRVEWWADDVLTFHLVNRFGTFVTVSDFNRKWMQDRYGLDPEVIHHGIRTERFENNQSGDVRALLNLDQESEILLFIGRFLEFKDVDTVIDAFPMITEQCERPVSLVLVGGGSRTDHVRRKVSELAVADQVTIVTDLPDRVLTTIITEATAFLFPSYAESFGLVYLEAMAGSLPIVYANAGAAPEVVNGAGIGVEPRNPEALAAAVSRLVNDSFLRSRLQHNCRKQVKHFTWARAAQKYVELYRRAINDG